MRKGEILQEATATGIDAIVGAMSTVTTLVGKSFDVMTSNPLLLVFLAASLLGVGIGVFRRIKRAAH